MSRGLFIVARAAAALVVGAALAAGAIVAAPAAFAGSDDYPAKWKNIPRDQTFDSWGEYNRECTSWVAWRLHGHNNFEMPFHANADDWGAKAKRLGYTVNMTPAVGAVAWWDTATRSHVAWVESVYSNNTVQIEEYNIGGSGRYDQTTIPTSSVSGYIHFQDLATSFTDNSYIEHSGNVYRMAGGAPIFVSTWSAYGKKPVGIATNKQWLALKKVPKDGTFVTSSTTNRIYEIVGGAPIFISAWSIVGGKKTSVIVPGASISKVTANSAGTPYAHLANLPAGSPYVVASPSNTIYQIVNGAPIPVQNWAAVGGQKPFLPVGDDDIVNAGSTKAPYTHLQGYFNTPVPTIKGIMKIHQKLTVSLGMWHLSGATISYRWMRDGKTLKGVTGATFTPIHKSSVGSTFSVEVTVTKPNYAPRSLTSLPTAKVRNG